MANVPKIGVFKQKMIPYNTSFCHLSTMKSEIPVKSDEVIKLESTWDGEELIEITEPPIVHDTSSFSSLLDSLESDIYSELS
jgi:hypothetical protein